MNNNKILAVVSIILLISCEMKTYLLKDGITKVPIKKDVYENKVKFDKSLLTTIDTGAIYEEFDTYRNVLKRLDSDSKRSFYGVYRFYANGKFNSFGIDKSVPLDSKMFNPEYRGYRGVYYLDKNQIRYDLFAPSNELRWIGKLTGTFRFSGDTLYVQRDESPQYINVYIKRELPKEFLQYNANW